VPPIVLEPARFSAAVRLPVALAFSLLALAFFASGAAADLPAGGKQEPTPLVPGTTTVGATTTAGAEAPKKLIELDTKLFPVPTQLEGAVDFWTSVYTRYHNDQVLLHDELHLHVVYAVLDLSELEKNGVSEVRKEQIKRQQVRETTDKYRSILLQLAEGKESKVWPQDTARVAALFAKVPGGNGKYAAAAERIRSQTCLRNRFGEAIYRSGFYMPEIEKVFKERSLPLDLTRLPFVESLFQWQAKSNVAAGGIWQFMPGTGRLFGLRSQPEYDERFDPLRATHAAARLLSDNFAALGAWPLAITAYNHGQGGMRRAVRVTGSTDMGVIATTYTGRAFGFASRNFYAEFLAAAKIYANREHHFPGLAAAEPHAFEEFRPAQYVKVGDLAAKAGIELDHLRELNPALSKAVWDNRLRLPKGYALKVPTGKKAALETAYAALPAEAKWDGQGGGRHTVRKGDTLGRIAGIYGTTVGDLQSANRLASAHSLRIGQVLIVPGREETKRAALPAPAPVATATPADPPTRLAQGGPAPAEVGGGQHVVRKGDTLDAIARRYGVSVDSLRKANKLRNHVIHPAQVLVIPADAP
jgi:membrane-bound lytic murein transglycosylase D